MFAGPTPTLLATGAAIFTIVACLLAPLVIGAAEPVAPKPASGTGDGTLEIVGKGVEKLVVVARTGGQEHQLDRPGPSVPLPAGRYWVKEVILRGGFARGQPHPRGSVPRVYQFAIVPGQSCRLEIGVPLTSTVTSQRRGSVLKLDYALIGADGWNYASRDRSDPPRFTVYQGDREIGSGSFKYG